MVVWVLDELDAPREESALNLPALRGCAGSGRGVDCISCEKSGVCWVGVDVVCMSDEKSMAGWGCG